MGHTLTLTVEQEQQQKQAATIGHLLCHEVNTFDHGLHNQLSMTITVHTVWTQTFQMFTKLYYRLAVSGTRPLFCQSWQAVKTQSK